MIVVDGSSFLALVRGADDSVIARARQSYGGPLYMAHTTGLETTFGFIGENGIESIRLIQHTIKETKLFVVPTTEDIRLASLAAFEAYGAGRHPQSTLSIGDCAAYVLAQSMGARLVSESDRFDIIGTSLHR